MDIVKYTEFLVSSLVDDPHPDNTSAAVASVIKVFFIIIPLSI